MLAFTVVAAAVGVAVTGAYDCAVVASAVGCGVGLDVGPVGAIHHAAPFRYCGDRYRHVDGFE